jgi:hypothetical protein
MESLRDQYKEITASLKKNGIDQEKLKSEEYDLETRQIELISKIILEEKLLQKSVWFLDERRQSSISISAETSIDEIISLIKGASFEFQFKLENGVSFHNNNNSGMTICFQRPTNFQPFVEKYGIKTSNVRVEREISLLKEKLVALEKMVSV